MINLKPKAQQIIEESISEIALLDYAKRLNPLCMMFKLLENLSVSIFLVIYKSISLKVVH